MADFNHKLLLNFCMYSTISSCVLNVIKNLWGNYGTKKKKKKKIGRKKKKKRHNKMASGTCLMKLTKELGDFPSFHFAF